MGHKVHPTASGWVSPAPDGEVYSGQGLHRPPQGGHRDPAALIKRTANASRQRESRSERGITRYGHDPYRQAGIVIGKGGRQRRAASPAGRRADQAARSSSRSKRFRQPELDAALVAANIQPAAGPPNCLQEGDEQSSSGRLKKPRQGR